MNHQIELIQPGMNGLPRTAYPGARPSFPASRLLVIGYGNELRGDDAAGPMVARAFANGVDSAISALAVPLLLPELAVDMAEAHKVVFVDASLRCSKGRVRLSRLESMLRQPLLSGAFCPEMIVGLCEILYGRRIRSWLLEIPASRFGFGDALSEATTNGIGQAMSVIHRWVRTSAHRHAEAQQAQLIG